MSDRIAPNPYSPFSNANPLARHVFPVPMFFGPPPAGVLAVAACEDATIVPEETAELGPDGELPDGMCPGCVTAMGGGEPPETSQTSEPCKTCESRGPDGMCLLCRMDEHDRWAARQADTNTPPAPPGTGDLAPDQLIPGFADMDDVHFSIPVSAIGEDGDMLLLGHVQPRYALAAANRHARRFLGQGNLCDDPEIAAATVMGRIEHTWATFTGFGPRAWDCRDASGPDVPGAVPVTVVPVVY